MTKTSPTPSIKTDIFEFCQAFAGILKPFAKSLENVRAGIQGKGGAGVLQRPMAGFSDVHHRLESLMNKVEQQQAYLIIFGPLKSGKSTLMNAISAAYVSEVTSLPAYPCLVHVKHGDDYSFVASRYSGEKLKFSDNASLQALIKQSHETLAERLREVEEQGERFDPGVHYPEAIRRVDVAVPTRNMKDSLTVMVDTPGLYTRMKFGYDLMTREFRNSAACAVFVVKTDNLFLEQVFEEFNDLLDLFSRIFIVVNIDSNKRDLNPDGSLKPSLESSAPGEVIRAFESLVMSAPLRRAQAAGRLKIYPIDLLNSASAAMKRAAEPPVADQGLEEAAVKEDEAAANAPAEEACPAAGEAAVEGVAADEGAKDAAAAPLNGAAPVTDGPAELANPLEPLPVFVPLLSGFKAGGEEAAAEAPEAAPSAEETPASVVAADAPNHPEALFSLFLKDLTDYLNSSDYLQEFMGDALLMGSNLGAEIQDHCSQQSTERFETSRKILQDELGDTEARLAGVEKLEALDIKGSFTRVRDESRKYAGEVSRAAAVEAQLKALKQLDEWFATDASVAALQGGWAALVRACGKRVSNECHAKVRSLASSPLGGIRIDENLRSSVPGLDELLGPAVEAVRATLGGMDSSLQSGTFRIEPDDLKVRKSLWDWLAFRSLAAVRRRIFGLPEALDREVPVAIKEKRLGEEGKLALKERIISELSRQFPSEAMRVSESLLTHYIESLCKELREKLRAGRDKYAARKAELTQRIEDNLALRQMLDDLTREAGGVLGEIDKLRQKYRTYSRVTGAAGATAAADLATDGDSNEPDAGGAGPAGESGADPPADSPPGEVGHGF